MQRQPLDNPHLEEHLKRISDDGIDVFVAGDQSVRGALLHGTELVNAMRANHQLGILETLILGHSYMAVGLMSTDLKEHGRVSISIDCSGPVDGIQVEATARGEIRGYLRNNAIPVDHELESFDISPFVGTGIISVTRYLESRKQPFTGQVLMEHGTIAKDMANYYLQSEQTPSAFNLSVQFDSGGTVVGAGGLFAQGLPEANKTNLGRMEDRIRALPSLGQAFADGRTGAEILRTHFHDLKPDIIGTRKAEFFCHCSKERFARFMAALPEHELEDMKVNGPFPLRTTCHNCGSTYEFDRDEVAELAERMSTRH